MQLTPEQQIVLDTNTDLVINAVAGSGKTTTLIAYAQTRPPGSRILYLAFNKTVKTEAIQKFMQAGLQNVRVETAHSLAYDYMIRNSRYQVVQGYRSHEWCDILDIRTGDRLVDFIVGSHVAKFISFFCNSTADKAQQLDYATTITDVKAAAFVKNFYSNILGLTRTALSKMDKGEIAVTHDFYLKKFQLSRPVLPYDYILFDEGQDASAAMLDVFLRQPATRIIVGDRHQQIYGWRYAVNSLQQVDFPVYHLSNSFRFGDEIALVANNILSWKIHLQQGPAVKIIGAGVHSDNNVTKAVLGRTNLSLLLEAISRWQHGQLNALYFEGNINSYTFADEGASLYDVLNLYNGKTTGIRDKLIAEMKSMRELESYIDQTEDNSLAMIVDVVKEFGNQLPSLINELKMHHTAEKKDADMIFSTVHRCKGMEYDEVTLLSDFISEDRLKKYIAQGGAEKMGEAERNRLGEEINILYVAATRARNKLIIPPDINPLRSIELAPPSLPRHAGSVKGYQRHSHLASPDMAGESMGYAHRSDNSGARKPGNAGKRWTREEDIELADLFGEGVEIGQIARQLHRGTYSIRTRLIKMGLLDEGDAY